MRMQEFTEGLTFDDVLLVPQHSDVMPERGPTSRRASRATSPLNVPLVVGRHGHGDGGPALAVALAREGGIGVIHRNLSNLEEQIREVDR